jgi:hypothetical protein
VESVALRDFMLNKHYEDPDLFLNNFNTAFTSDPAIKRQIFDRLRLGQTFGLGFDFVNAAWYVMDSSDMAVSDNMLGGDFPDYEFSPVDYSHGDTSWVLYCEFNPDCWRLYGRGLAYVFESERSCKFFFINESTSIDPQTGRIGVDTIKLLKRPNGLPAHLQLKLEKPYVYSDGYLDPNKVRVRLFDSNADGIYDHPDSYYLAGGDTSLMVHRVTYTTDGYAYERLVRELESAQEFPLAPLEYGYVATGSAISLYRGQDNNINLAVIDSGGAHATLTVNPNLQSVGNQSFRVRNGANELAFQWKHFAPSTHRIDPAVSNIIDMFVLTRDYNDAMLAWRNAGAVAGFMPKPPSELQLRQTFNQLSEFKMFSDEMIWRPVKFKLLFGDTAPIELQAKFKVVKMNGSSLSDGEIRSKVVQSIHNFFDVNMWEFGETFFFSELGAYIHRQLSTAISSVEIVPTRGSFGKLREIKNQPDELFFATAEVGDVEIISANTPLNLRIR